MPRLNVEDEFWSDTRVDALREKLGKFQAWGVCLGMWKLAQRFWNGSCKPIPRHEWDLAGFPKEVFEVGLAKENEDGVYVSGSQRHFEWYKKKCEAGKTGGKASAAKRTGSEATSAQASVDECSSTKQPSSSSSSSSSKNNKTIVVLNPSLAAFIESINKVTGRSYSTTTKSTVSAFKARQAEFSPSFEEWKTIPLAKAKEWRDTEYFRYVCPSTLLRPEKFENYLNDARAAMESERKSMEAFGALDV